MRTKFRLSLLALLFTVSLANAQQKHALIFAIGEYPEEGGWSKISSAQDVAYIKNTLLKQGFKETGIKTVSDSVATKAGIENALKNLIATVNPKDVVVIHFSSHGEQVADNNGDEADGYDETIVSYDAKLSADKEAVARGSVSKTEYEKLQANYFRDDEFGKYIQELRTKLGKEGDVMVVMDNCHSGTGTRGSAKVRGGKGALKPDGYNPASKKQTGDEVFQENAGARGTETDLATYVVISAALASELNYETTGDDAVSMGSLTYAFSKVFENLPAGTTYRTLFAKIQAIMNEKVPGQHPVLEGNGLDRSLFGGNFVNQKPYFTVEKITTPLDIVVKAGTFAGLNVGAKVNVYPAGTADPSKATPLAKGVVTKASNYQSTIKLDKSTKVAQPSLLFVFVSEPVFNVKPIVVAIATSRGNNNYSATETDNISAALKKLKLVTMVGTPDLLIEKGNGDDTIKVASNGFPFANITNAADTAELRKVINRYAQYQLLQKLVVKDSTVTAQVKLVKVTNGKPDEKFMAAKFQDIPYEFNEGDTIMLWVKNPSKKDIYVNILDIQPNGQINPMLPNTSIEKPIVASELKIPAGQTRTFPEYIILLAPPLGTEIFKVFVTTKEINIEGLATPESEQVKTRGDLNLSQFESLMINSNNTATRGAQVSVKPTDGSVFNILFRIKEKQ
ncbi:DUF4384 domain-containing protein [Pedobacter polaris]|uniref:DUF4384 domain-containing protein n=1 Tax=Pedobacter polaris TaxID=2571273 RepID=A0A4U1CJB6_9SPHI|nr:caspase family protein [Pedobacter polaris]TKC06820.1 DUF4384 domain-containing protein [Pedobacter polaris]